MRTGLLRGMAAGLAANGRCSCGEGCCRCCLGEDADLLPGVDTVRDFIGRAGMI